MSPFRLYWHVLVRELRDLRMELFSFPVEFILSANRRPGHALLAIPAKSSGVCHATAKLV